MKKTFVMVAAALTAVAIIGCGNSNGAEVDEQPVMESENNDTDETNGVNSTNSINESSPEEETVVFDSEGRYVSFEEFYKAEMDGITLDMFFTPDEFEKFEKAETIVEENDVYLNFYLKEGMEEGFERIELGNIVVRIVSQYIPNMGTGKVSKDCNNYQFIVTVFDYNENELFSYIIDRNTTQDIIIEDFT